MEAHFRGLESMSVDKNTYSAILVPVLMEKLPKQVQLNMMRDVGKTMLEWTVDEEYSDKDPQEKKNILKRHFCCFVCLRGNHKSFECKSKARCRYCKGRHNVAICINRPPPSSPAPAATPAPNAVPASQEIKPANAAPTLNPNASAYVGSACSGGKVALQTAAANVIGMKEGKV